MDSRKSIRAVGAGTTRPLHCDAAVKPDPVPAPISPPLNAFVRRTGYLLKAELRLLSWRGPRAVLAAQTVAAVLLAVLLADLLALSDRWWVAISAYVVMRADWQTSLRRGWLRMAGTLGGAIFSVVLAPWLTLAMPVYALGLGLIAGAGVYLAVGSTRSYGWLLAAITAALVLSDAIGAADVLHIALLRVADVAVGTLACVAVAGLVEVGRHYFYWPQLADFRASPAAGADSTHANRLRLWQALPSAITIAVLAGVDFYWRLPDFTQMLVTVIVIPVIPLATLIARDQSEAAVASRMGHRLAGCLLAAACALPLLPWIGDRPLLFLPLLATCIWLASHIQSGHGEVSYIGLQFGIALLMIFVQDQAWSTDLQPALLRLAGILAGVLALALVRLAVTRLRTRSA